MLVLNNNTGVVELKGMDKPSFSVVLTKKLTANKGRTGAVQFACDECLVGKCEFEHQRPVIEFGTEEEARAYAEHRGR